MSLFYASAKAHCPDNFNFQYIYKVQLSITNFKPRSQAAKGFKRLQKEAKEEERAEQEKETEIIKR